MVSLCFRRPSSCTSFSRAHFNAHLCLKDFWKPVTFPGSSQRIPSNIPGKVFQQWASGVERQTNGMQFNFETSQQSWLTRVSCRTEPTKGRWKSAAEICFLWITINNSTWLPKNWVLSSFIYFFFFSPFLLKVAFSVSEETNIQIWGLILRWSRTTFLISFKADSNWHLLLKSKGALPWWNWSCCFCSCITSPSWTLTCKFTRFCSLNPRISAQ